VTAVEIQEEKRFWRSQPIGPALESGGLRGAEASPGTPATAVPNWMPVVVVSAMAQRSTSAMRAA
jgi:hypothetical protein